MRMMVSKILDYIMAVLILVTFMLLGFLWLGVLLSALLIYESISTHRKVEEAKRKKPEYRMVYRANVQCPYCRNDYNANAKECPRC